MYDSAFKMYTLTQFKEMLWRFEILMKWASILLSSGMCSTVVWYRGTTISKEPAAYLFSI